MYILQEQGQIAITPQTPNFTHKKADELYAEAGTLVKEVEPETIVEGDSIPDEHPLVRSVVHAAKLSFTLDTFQHLSLCAIASNKNVILSAPCGSGKFLVISLATDLIRIKERKPKGVSLVILPLTAIMREVQKNNTDICYITMEGNVIGEAGEEVTISDTIEAILGGKYKMILGLSVKIAYTYFSILKTNEILLKTGSSINQSSLGLLN